MLVMPNITHVVLNILYIYQPQRQLKQHISIKGIKLLLKMCINVPDFVIILPLSIIFIAMIRERDVENKFDVHSALKNFR